MPAGIYWVVRHVKQGYLLDGCAGGVFTGPEALTWEARKVVEEVLTWSNPFDARAAMDGAEIPCTDECEVVFIELPS